MMTTQETIETLKSLKDQHKTNWLTFSAKLDQMLAKLAERTGVTWDSTEDITDHVTAADFVAAGFTEAEAEAMIFVLTEDCMDQPVNSVEMIDRWFCYEMQ